MFCAEEMKMRLDFTIGFMVKYIRIYISKYVLTELQMNFFVR